MSRLDEIISDLQQRKRSISCNGKSGLLLHMEEMGFTWKDGKTEGHKVFIHEELTKKTDSVFTTHSIDCGHYPSRSMKFQYVINTVRMLRKYQSELTEIMSDK